MAPRGRFITLEGGEGAGKSTQVKRLVERLKPIAGADVIATREPGGTPSAEAIRDLLVADLGWQWDRFSEVMLHFAARREHLTKIVWPALARGAWVISDRFADSTTAYQGYGLGVDLELIGECYRLAVGRFAPDLTLILDIPEDQARQRLAERGLADDRYEGFSAAFHDRVREGFRTIAAREPERCVLVDATHPAAQVTDRLVAAIETRLCDHG